MPACAVARPVRRSGNGSDSTADIAGRAAIIGGLISRRCRPIRTPASDAFGRSPIGQLRPSPLPSSIPSSMCSTLDVRAVGR